MFEKIAVNLAGEVIELRMANTPKELGDIFGRQGFFCSNLLQYALQNNEMANQLKKIANSFATIYTLVGDVKMKELYFKDSDVSALTNLVNLIADENVFVKGTKERKIVVEMIVAYEKYNETAGSYMDFDEQEEGLLFFRKKEVQKQD